MRTINVTGKGKITVKPDTTRIYITLDGLTPEYGETLKMSADDTKQLKDLLAQFGFKHSDLKTLNFYVDTDYKSVKQEDGSYKSVLAGYKYCHRMKVEFPSDNALLGKLLYALANCELRPDLGIGYTVADREAAKNELLGKAVADAKAKATVLAQASCVTLGDIQHIDYSWGSINFEYRPMDRMLMNCVEGAKVHESYDIDIEPDDIDVTDDVTIVWEIA